MFNVSAVIKFNGTVTRLSGTVDPLANIPFVARLQTHLGDNVPLGIYTDMAGTIPAVTGDTVRSWNDELSGNSHLLTSTGVGITMEIVSGVPVLRFPGQAGMTLGESFAVAQPHHIVYAYKNRAISPASGDEVTTGNSPDNCAILEVDTPSSTVYAGAGFSVSITLADNFFNVISASFNGADSILRSNGSQVGAGNAGTDDRTGLCLPAFTGGRRAAVDVIAVLIPVNWSDVPACEAYLADLLPA